MREPNQALCDDPLWYKDAIIYQVHIRSFYDSNADGIGDFKGLTEKLDYIESLGVTAIWILPFYPSPLKDDGYDIANFTAVHPMYGTLKDFGAFLQEAHRRGLRVITELVINHTSDQHAWFQRARQSAPGSRERNFYVWSDSPDKYAGARIIFKDFEPSNWTFDPVTKQYYWHRFYAHQPDLNFDSIDVRKSMIRILDFWLGKGVDGLRLDAIPYLYEREGTSCENLPETHGYVKELRRHVDSQYANRMLLAEANQWPEDVVAYFGTGDECHMAFHFPIMPRLFMALRLENQFPIVDILEQTPAIPASAQWAMFLRNHDELTLEMVTDKERDYMYQVYARDPSMRLNLGIRRRLAPLLKNDRRQIELLNCLLFSLPGTPILYYGDEIGMGDNVYLGDRNGVRTPMQWNADRNAGFSAASPQRLYLPVILDPEYHYEAVNVQTQQNNRRSLLWWMRHLIAVRKDHKAFSRGSVRFLPTGNQRILALLRHHEGERILVLANLSSFPQYSELDLSEFAGRIPRELFGQTQFPAISTAPYIMTFAPYGYYWLLLEERPEPEAGRRITLRVQESWQDVLKGRNRSVFSDALQRFLVNSPWFLSPDQFIDHLVITDEFKIYGQQTVTVLLIIQVEFYDGSLERYLLPVTYAMGKKADEIEAIAPQAIIATVKAATISGVVYDATYSDQFFADFFSHLKRRRLQRGLCGTLLYDAKKTALDSTLSEKISVTGREHRHVHATFGETMTLKLYRNLDPGMNPDVECARFLSDVQRFPHSVPFLGTVTYDDTARPLTLATLYGSVSHQGTMWDHTLGALMQSYERISTRSEEYAVIPEPPARVYDFLGREPEPFSWEFFGITLNILRLVGQRTAELHRALGETGTAAFRPEPFTDFTKHSQYQSMYGLTKETMRSMHTSHASLPSDVQPLASMVMAREAEIIARFKQLRDTTLSSQRIRIHGDYILGKLLFTGKDIVVTDFEGEPGRSLSERRNKLSPFRDVATLLRSLHYASFSAASKMVKPEQLPQPGDLERARRLWYGWASATVLSSYLEASRDASFTATDPMESRILLDAFLLERALVELRNELANRPDRVRIPLEGILQILSAPQPQGGCP